MFSRGGQLADQCQDQPAQNCDGLPERASLARLVAASELQNRMKEWFAGYGRTSLLCLPFEDELRIWDTRPGAVRREHRLSGPHRLVYEYCDEARTRRALELFWPAGARGPSHGTASLDEILADLTGSKLLLYEDDHWLSLGVDGDYQIGVLASHNVSGTRLQHRSAEPLRLLYETAPDAVQALVAERMRSSSKPQLEDTEELLRVLQ